MHPFTREIEAYSDPDRAYFDSLNRERIDNAAEDWLIDGLIPIGASVIYADPGAGKSMVVQQVIHHLAYGRPLGPWGTPTEGGHLVRVFDLEGWWKLTQDRGYAITPYGSLPQDGSTSRTDHFIMYSGAVIPPPDVEAWRVIQSQPERHAQYLESLIRDSAEAGIPVSMVVIDTLSKWAGPRPRNSSGNAYEYEAAVVDRLNRIGLEHRCGVVLIHHTNKAGEISGSQGIGGSAMVTARLELEDRTDEDRDQGVPVRGALVSTKVRHGADFRYQLEQRPDDGVWEFVDKPASEAQATGHARAVLSALAGGPQTRKELIAATGIGSSLSQVLARLRRSHAIVSKYGAWHLVSDPRRTVPGQADATCSVCSGPMTLTDPGQTCHPGCVSDGAAVSDGVSDGVANVADGVADGVANVADGVADGVANVADGVADGVANVSDGVANVADGVADGQDVAHGIAELKASLERSRMHPVPVIKLSARSEEPWTLIHERMTGEHRWARHVTDADMDSRVITLDRRGSYPSAMGSVPVAANLLNHTGPLGEIPSKTAGIFQVPAVEWKEPGIGHPLGRIAQQDSDTWWVTTPHMLLLERLCLAGRIDNPRILDSWTGRGTVGLFTQFSKNVQHDRLSALEAEDMERLAEVKRKASVAIRLLWPKTAHSPFWRPDWSVSVRAEAAVRHWVMADKAASGGATCLKIGAVDEVAFLVGEGNRVYHVPDPYVVGDRYGQVSVKSLRPYSEWKEDRANRAR
jgi:hypothetical protein